MPTINIEQFDSSGLEEVWWAKNDSSGYPMGPTGTLANGADASMSQLLGANSLNLPLQQPRQVNVPGDDGVSSVFFFQPEALPSGDLAIGTFDVNFFSQAQGTKVYADGDWDTVVGAVNSPTYSQFTMMTVSQGKSKASGSSGQAGYMVKIFPKVQVVPLADAGLSNATATSFTHALIANKSSIKPWGAAFSVANDGTTEAAVIGPFWSEFRPLIHTFVGDGSTATVTLAKLPQAASANKVKLWEDGTALALTTDFTVVQATGVVTLVAPLPAAGAKVIIRYERA
jgi:hypothetical protein